MPDAGPFGSASVVVFGLATAALWGAADFGGGLVSRRSSVLGVVLFSQAAGALVALGLTVVRGESLPSSADMAWALATGVLATVGILGLYGGLAIGRMSIVAPVTSVLAALVPVAFGIVTQGPPVAVVLVGIALAISAVVLVSRVPDEREPADARSGLGHAVVGGIGLGLASVAISRVDPALVFGPVAMVRATEATAVGLIVVALRRPTAITGALLPAVLLVGVLDMAGNAGFLFARQSGPLAIAATLSSLYAITTVLLAALVLRERLTISHGVGIATALAGIALISAGSVGSA
jgi:drug/metabolite transporter (DMT)-like permease